MAYIFVSRSAYTAEQYGLDALFLQGPEFVVDVL
jgi:hypothetical protein